jgi:1-acyl-sn-glycerol-3-phosphate acyltransferase
MFRLTLVIFHPIQWVCFRILVIKRIKKSVDYLNPFLLDVLELLGQPTSLQM